MSKMEFMKKNNIQIREVTEFDRKAAKTDYQRASAYVISHNGREWFSKRGTLSDMKAFVDYCKQSPLDYAAN